MVKKKPPLLFYIIALLIPLLTLLAVEGLLRLSPFYKQYPMFVAAPAMPGYLQTNPELIKRYFANPGQAPDLAIDTQYILAEKPPGQIRVVLQGGSSAAGFPYGRFGSPAAMLQQRLKRLYPEHDILVINTAMSAVNSYTLRDLSADILAIKPDLVIIYAGHNEYLGIMGVGSALLGTGSQTSKWLYLQLRQLALFQFGQQLWGLFSSADNALPANERTMMARIAAEQHIELDSPLYQAGIKQFQANMQALARTYQQAGVPLIFSTLASNERQAPFVSSKTALTVPEDATAAIAVLQQALQQDNRVASWHFQLAELLLAAGKRDSARQHFQLAREHDLLRFRAPMAINQQLSALAAAYNLSLVDSEQALRQATKDGIIGYDLMLEHLHPNARGYFLLAESWLPAVKSYIGATAAAVTTEQAWADIPLTPTDLLLAEYKIKQLTADYPFVSRPQQVSFGPQNTLEQQLAWQRTQGLSWLESSKQLLTHYQQQQQPAQAAKVAALLFDALPNHANSAFVAGQLYFDSKDLALAAYYQQRAVALAPDELLYRLMLARTYYFSDRWPEALQQVEQVLARDPNHAVALRQQAQLTQQMQQAGQ
ncbi:tetratricopeptide repeat protein [Alishewanella longhuensis]|nr:tetratricopeptide repeat protein [Alishewanella longhuensis]